MIKRIHRILFYALLFPVYGVFFSVESFFNFEGQVNAKDIFTYSSSVHSAGGPGVIKTTPLRSTSSHNIRLNKRYHQENIPPCPIVAVAAPEVYIIRDVLTTYRTPSLPSITLIHHPLRGPPVLV